jgi:Ca2+-binding RTX toxin-like protein
MVSGAGLAAKFTHAGTWKPAAASFSNGKYIGHIVPAFADLPVGPAGLHGIVASGWAFYDTTLPNGTPPVPVTIAVLEQQPDGTMRQATASLLNGAALTNGAQYGIIHDVNGDGRLDALLLPYNEAPYTATKGIILQGNAKGGLDRVDLADSVITHAVDVVTLNGTPSLLTTSWQVTPANPSFVLDGKGGVTLAAQPRIGLVNHAASTAADFDGDGDSEIVFTDVTFSPNAAGTVEARKHGLYLYETKGLDIAGEPIAMPAPYFNERPQYAGISSAFGINATHIPYIRARDFNHDGKPDLLGLASLWPAKYNTLQMLQNTGSLKFSDVTDQYNPDFTISSDLGDYNLQFIDVDGSGIDTIIMSGSAFNYATTGHANYILLNDGTGRLHVAFHKEFQQIAKDVDTFHRGMMTRGEAGFSNMYGIGIGLGVFADDNNFHQFRAYVTASGTINFVDLALAYGKVPSGSWDITYSFVNVPVGYDIRTDFITPVTIANRNGSDRIRTFAGADTIHRTGGAATATVDGGLGTDRAIYGGAFADYALAATATGWTLADQRPAAPDGTDHLRNVELLQFADRTIGVGTQGDDIVSGSTGATLVDGGAGTDTLALAQPRAQYRVGVFGTTVHLEGPDGPGVARNIEALSFAGTAPISLAALLAEPDTDHLYQNLVSGALRFGMPTRYAGPNPLDYILPADNGDDILQGTARRDFANLGAGNDAASMGDGNDVVDGGGGSNFLTGGAGQDTFFIDGRDLVPVWSCITDWQAGEALTLWGWRDGVSSAAWSDEDGLPGYKGATMFADIDGNGIVETAITWTGIARADLPESRAFEVGGIGVLYFS